ncbi:MAG: hypothetical protein HY905_19980 [Deltaproteobacteria bacterium]|nr:hypothetical protein [Deltaproteobacteria bacterium]
MAGDSGDDLSDLIGPELAAELRTDEETITGQPSGNPAYLGSGAGGAGTATGAGELGPSNLMNPALSLVATFGAAYFTDDRHVPRSGPVPDSTGVHFLEAELGLEAAVDPYFYLKGFFALGADDFETEEVFAETLRLPGGLKFRAGQFLTAFGRSNPTHAHVWEFIDAPLTRERFFSGEGLRSPGLEASWLTPLPFYLKLVAAASMADVPAPGSTPDEATFGKDRDYDFLYSARLESFIPLSDTWSLVLGASAVTGPSGQGAGDRSDVFGGDAFLRYKPTSGDDHFEFKLTAEGDFRRRQFPGNRLTDWAAYLEASFRLAQQWRVALRGDADEGDLTRGDTLTGPARDLGEERGALSVTFFPTEFSLLRLQGNLSHPHGDAWDGPEWVGEFYLEAMFALGAHGAHPF